MKRSQPIQRKTELRASGRPERKARPKSKHYTKDWRGAVAKKEREGVCRRCKTWRDLECAHTIGKAYQDVWTSKRRSYVPAAATIPLCRSCHIAYDGRRISIRGLLTFRELMNAARACKKHGLDLRRRIEGGRA